MPVKIGAGTGGLRLCFVSDDVVITEAGPRKASCNSLGRLRMPWNSGTSSRPYPISLAASEVARHASATNKHRKCPDRRGFGFRIGHQTTAEAGSYHLGEGNNQPALSDQRSYQPLQKCVLDRYQLGLGREVGLEQGDVLFDQRLGLPFGESALGQTQDKAVSVENDELCHDRIMGTSLT